eukprot:PITA_27522
MADAGTGLKNSQLPQFNGKNHNDWSIKMKALFASQGIWELVEIGYAEPADATTLAALTVAERDQLKSDKKKDAKALFFLFQSVHESVFPRIAAATKSKEAWDILEIAYQGMEKIPLLSKHSRLRCLSAKEKAEAEQITEVVEEAKTEADIILQAQAEGAAIRTKMKVQANSKLMDKGMTNPKSNVIIVRNMGTMPMNVGKNKMT